MASKKEWSIAFKIGAQLASNYPAAFKSAQKHMAALQKAAKNTGESWKNLSSKTGTLLKQVMGLTAAVVGTAFALAQTTASAGEAAAKTSAQLGLSVEGYQGLQYAMRQAGVSAEDFDSNMGNLQRTLAQASRMGDKDPFRNFGLSAKKIMALPMEKRLERIADYLKQVKDPAEQAAVATRFFGKTGGAEMLEALKMGSAGLKKFKQEFKDTGAGITTDQAAQAREYMRVQKNLLGSFTDIRNAIGIRLLPAFTKCFEKAREAINRNMPSIKEFGERLGEAIDRNIPQIEEMIKSIVDFGKQIWGVIKKVKDFVGGWKNLAIIIAALKVMPIAIAAVTFAMNAYMFVSKAVTLVQWAMNAAFIASPIGWIVLGIVAAVAALGVIFVAVYKKSETFRNVIAGAMNVVSALFKSALGFAVNLAKGIGFVAVQIGKAFFAAFDYISSFIAWTMDEIGAFITDPIGSIKLAWSKLTDFYSWLWGDVIGGVVTFAADFIDNALGLNGKFSALVRKIPGFFTDAFKSAVKLGEDFVKNILGKFKPIADFFGSIGDKVSKIFGGKKKLEVEAVMSGAQDAIPAHAAGGIFKRPHIATFAENAPRIPEAAIPVEKTARSFNLWKQVGEMAGFGTAKDMAGQASDMSGFDASPVISPMMKGGSNTTISLSMPITINGDATQETVKALESSRDDVMAGVRRMVEQVMTERSRREKRLSYAR